MKKTLILYLIFLLFSCKNKPYDEYLDNPRYNNNEDYSYTLKLVDSLNIISSDSIGIQFSYTSILNDTMFYGIPFNDKKIYVFNFKKQRYSFTIKVPPHLLTDNICNINVINSDSIYFLSNRAYQLYLINSKAEVLKKTNIPNVRLNIDKKKLAIQHNLKEISKDMPLFGFPLYINEKNPEIINDSIALIAFYIMGVDEFQGLENAERFGLFNLKTNQWIKVLAPPEGIMKNLGNKSYPYDLCNPNYCVVNKKLYVSYPMDNYIYVYNIITGKYIEKKIASSTFCERIPAPLPNSILTNQQKSWNFRISTPYYKEFYYHSKLQMFTRVFHHEQDVFQEDGKLNEGKKRKGSVIILDKDLNIVGEKVFENAELGYNIAKFSDGLLINRSGNYWKKENEFVHKYIYKIVKKK